MLQTFAVRSYQVFASMSPEQAVDLLRGLAKAAPGVAAQAVGAAAVAEMSARMREAMDKSRRNRSLSERSLALDIVGMIALLASIPACSCWMVLVSWLCGRHRVRPCAPSCNRSARPRRLCPETLQ